jgi:hypothetical protein
MVKVVGVVIPVAGHPFNPGVAIPEIIAVLTIPFAVELTAVVVTTAVENAGVPITWPGATHAVCTSRTALPAVDEE